MPQVVVNNLDKLGVVSDIAPFNTPPNAFTSARNVSFINGGVAKSGNRTEVLVPAEERANATYSKDGAIYYGTKDSIYRNTGVDNILMNKGGLPYTPIAHKWNITELSNVLIFNNGVEAPQMLIPQQPTFADLTAWGYENGEQKTWTVTKMVAYKNFLLALGVIEDGTEYPQRVRWSDLAVPNQAPPTWDATDTTASAGFNDLSEARGNIIDAVPMGDYLVLYTAQDVFIVSYVGGNNIFAFRKSMSDVSILAEGCAVNINGGHFLVTTNDVVFHNGSTWQSIITDRIKEELFSAVRTTDYRQVRVQNYPAKNEVWILYPSAKGMELDRAAIYSTVNQTWTFRELPNLTCIGYGVVPSKDSLIDEVHDIINDNHNIINGVGKDFIKSSLYAVSSDLKFWAVDEGVTGSINIPCTLIKQSMDFDDWGVEATQHKQIKAVYPQFSGSGTVMISIGVAENPYEAPKWSVAVPFRIGTDRKADFRVTGRYISIRFQGFENAAWTLLSYGIDGAPRGMR